MINANARRNADRVTACLQALPDRTVIDNKGQQIIDVVDYGSKEQKDADSLNFATIGQVAAGVAALEFLIYVLGNMFSKVLSKELGSLLMSVTA